MTAVEEIREVIARALCLDDDNGPCAMHTGDAGDVMAALTLAGYFQTDDGAVGFGGGASPSAGPGASAPSSLPPQTGDGAGETQPAEGADHLTPAAQADAAHGAPAPSSPRRFFLYRHTDLSGVSGTGIVAEGVQFTDGSVALRWRGPNPSTVAWDNIERIIAVHGHQGSTTLVWTDAACRKCGCTAEAACEPDGCFWVEAVLCSACVPVDGA